MLLKWAKWHFQMADRPAAVKHNERIEAIFEGG